MLINSHRIIHALALNPFIIHEKDSSPFQRTLFRASYIHLPYTPAGTLVQRILSLRSILLYSRRDTRRTHRKSLSHGLHSILSPCICTSFPAYSHNRLFLHLTPHDPDIRFSTITLQYDAVLHLISHTDGQYISGRRHSHFRMRQSLFPSLSSFLNQNSFSESRY